MKAQRTGVVRESWLLMLREGGHWSSKELNDRFGYDIHTVLLGMVAKGYAAKYGAGHDTRFGVTRSCKVPTGVTLSELSEAGALL